MIAGLVVLITIQVLAIIANIAMVGKERKPTTPGVVAVSVIISMMIIAFYCSLIYVLNGRVDG